MDNRLRSALNSAIAEAKRAALRAKKPEASAKAETRWHALLDLHDYIRELEIQIEAASPHQPETDNPFKAFTYPSDNGPVQTYHCAADDRLRALANFDQAQCEAALRVPGLQASVRNALERRLRKLTREATVTTDAQR